MFKILIYSRVVRLRGCVAEWRSGVGWVNGGRGGSISAPVESEIADLSARRSACVFYLNSGHTLQQQQQQHSTMWQRTKRAHIQSRAWSVCVCGKWSTEYGKATAEWTTHRMNGNGQQNYEELSIHNYIEIL